MKKSLVFGLSLVLFLAILACGTAPAPKPAPVAQTPPPPAAAPVEQPQGLVLDGAANYTVGRGDTLADISANRYGGGNMYYFPLIRLANVGAVSNPDEIEVGTNLVIPDLQRNLNSDNAKALIRQDMLSIAGQYEKQGKPKAASTLRNLASKLSK